MDTPQELIVWYVIPSIRKEYVLSLKEKGLSQKKIALLLGLTDAAVSQYLKNKRGNRFDIPKRLSDWIKASAESVSDGKEFRKELQKAINIAKKEGMVCSMCKKHLGFSKDCDICKE